MRVLGDGGDWTDPSATELINAVAEQAPYVRRWLASRGLAADVDEVLTAVLEVAARKREHWRTMDPRPGLAAWVTGIAQRELLVHERRGRAKAPGSMSGRRRRDLLVEVGLEDLSGAGAPVRACPAVPAPGEDGEVSASVRGAVEVLASALGVAAWKRVLARARQAASAGERALLDEVRDALEAIVDGRRVVMGPHLAAAAGRIEVRRHRTENPPSGTAETGQPDEPDHRAVIA